MREREIVYLDPRVWVICQHSLTVYSGYDQVTVVLQREYEREIVYLDSRVICHHSLTVNNIRQRQPLAGHQLNYPTHNEIFKTQGQYNIHQLS